MFGSRSIALTACASCAYHAGSFAAYDHEFAGVRGTFGCVDASIARRADRATGPVIAYEFGNGCDHPVAIDLGRIDAFGRALGGGEVVLRPYDPEHEIRAALLDGRSTGEESIEYVADGTAVAIASVCIDPAEAFGATAPRWSCFSSAP